MGSVVLRVKGFAASMFFSILASKHGKGNESLVVLDHKLQVQRNRATS